MSTAPTTSRAFVAVTFAGGAGVLAYILLWIVLPPAAHGELPARAAGTGVTSQGGFWLGAFLIVLGLLLSHRVGGR